MQFEELLRDREREGLVQGRAEERNRILALTAAMAAAGEAEQIARLSSDPAFFEEMLSKYHLQDADAGDTRA